MLIFDYGGILRLWKSTTLGYIDLLKGRRNTLRTHLTRRSTLHWWRISALLSFSLRFVWFKLDCCIGSYLSLSSILGNAKTKILDEAHFRYSLPIWDSCRCSRKLGMVEGWFSKWFLSVKKGVLNLSYLYLWHTMWFHAEKLLKTIKFGKLLNSLCKSGSRPQKSPKKAQKTDHSIAIYSNFWIGMVYFGCHLVNPHV